MELFYLDANTVIYAVEAPRPFTDGQRELLARIDSGEAWACTSELTLAECLVAPYATGNRLLAALYERFLTDHENVDLISIDRAILRDAAYHRATSKTKLADSIHVATAIAASASAIITNDYRMKTPSGLPRLIWEEI